MDEVRRVAQQIAAFAQRFAHERQAALLQIADATVNEFRAATGSGLSEIGLLDQRRAIAARRRFDRRGQTARAATNHQHIPDVRLIPYLLQHFSAVHNLGNDCLTEHPPPGEICLISQVKFASEQSARGRG